MVNPQISQLIEKGKIKIEIRSGKFSNSVVEKAFIIIISHLEDFFKDIFFS